MWRPFGRFRLAGRFRCAWGWGGTTRRSWGYPGKRVLAGQYNCGGCQPGGKSIMIKTEASSSRDGRTSSAHASSPSLSDLSGILPVQVPRRSGRSAEQLLQLAVLEEAVSQLEYGSAGKAAAGWEEARGWLMSPDSTYLFSFSAICESLGFDPDHMRRGILDRLSEGGRLCARNAARLEVVWNVPDSQRARVRTRVRTRP